MKKNLVILASTILVIFGCKAQTVITGATQNSPTISQILMSKGISTDVDSLLNIEFIGINSQLQTSKTRSQIEELINGIWVGTFQTRSTGKEKVKIENSSFNFSSAYNFSEISEKGILKGEYFIETDSTSNLVLIYDEPQYPYPEDMLANMTIQEKEQIAYQVRFLNIFEIDSENLILFTVAPIFDYNNPTTITHSRLILERYVKK